MAHGRSSFRPARAKERQSHMTTALRLRRLEANRDVDLLRVHGSPRRLLFFTRIRILPVGLDHKMPVARAQFLAQQLGPLGLDLAHDGPLS